MNKTPVFFISDSTGITAKTLGSSVLSQFDEVDFDPVVLPYIDSVKKATQVMLRIKDAREITGIRPIIFDTVVNPDIHAILRQADALHFDILNQYLKPLEQELGHQSSFTVGKAHGGTDNDEYKDRINAVHFAMENDDGGKTRQYDQADIILVGVSRCGKTPTSLYLALQFGIFAANYPITEDDFDDLENFGIPKALKHFKKKIVGLTIEPERLSSIRNERKSGSRYASLRQCEYEVNEAESMYRQMGIDCITTTDVSIEEIAAKVLASAGIERT